MGVQAKITLTSLNKTIFPTKRIITLNPEISKISIGRASKNSNKALHSAEDNAWFDSPVMSRDHAEISLDTEIESLILRDVGSMHGTCVNSSSLDSFAPTQLHNGDIIVFGTEVKRGSESYPPCKFLVNYDIFSHKAPKTYGYPEDSEFDDDDDDDDISLDRGDLEQDRILPKTEEQDHHSEKDISAKNTQTKTATDVSDDSGVMSRGDNNAGMVTDTKNLQLKKITTNLEPLEQRKRSEKNSLIEPEFAASSKIADQKQDSESLGSISPKNSVNVIETEKAKHIHSVNAENCEEPTSVSESPGEVPLGDIKNDCVMDTSRTHTLLTCKSEKSCISSDYDSDFQSDYGISSPVDERVNTLFDNGLNSNDDCKSSQYTYDQLKYERGNKMLNGDLSRKNIAELDLTESLTSTEDSIRSSVLPGCSIFPESEDKCPVTNNVSLINFPTQGREQNLHFQNYPSFNLDESWDQILGEKSGKTAYFRAREYNKAKIRSMSYHVDETNSHSVSVAGQRLKNLKYLSEQNPVSLFTSIDRNRSQQDIQISNRYFLVEKSITGNEEREPSLDSYVTDATNSSRKPETNVARDFKSGIKTDNTSQSDLTLSKRDHSVKRKADAISLDDGEKIFAYANNSSSTSQDSFTSTSTEIREQNCHTESPAVLNAQPSKRQKLIENIGYVALGGFAGAAGLFSILVSTAPNFS